MGQCCARLKSKRRRKFGGGRRQYRHKRFDYTPQRSWRYNDEQVLNQISLRGTEYDSPVWELEERGEGGGGGRERDGRGATGGGGGGGGGVGGRRERTLLNTSIDDSDGEDEVGEIRSGGRLVFAESEDHDEVLPPTPTTDLGTGSRDRSASNSSQRIGRFEVFEVTTGAEGGEGGVVDADISEMDTTQLLGRKLT